MNLKKFTNKKTLFMSTQYVISWRKFLFTLIFLLNSCNSVCLYKLPPFYKLLLLPPYSLHVYLKRKLRHLSSISLTLIPDSPPRSVSDNNSVTHLQYTSEGNGSVLLILRAGERVGRPNPWSYYRRKLSSVNLLYTWLTLLMTLYFFLNMGDWSFGLSQNSYRCTPSTSPSTKVPS